MATQGTFFLGAIILALACSLPAVAADIQVKNLMYGSREPPLKNLKSVAMNNTVSPQCRAEVDKLLSGDMKTLVGDAVMALDAFGKPPAGILQLNTAWLGHYDECMAIEGFNYCLTMLSLNLTSIAQNVPSFNQSMFAQIKQMNIQWGVCPPANCSETDVLLVLNELLDGLKLLERFGIPTDALKAAYAICTKNPTIPYDAGVICTVTLFSIIASLMIIGALYDEYLQLKLQRSAYQTLILSLLRPFRLLDETDEADEDADDVPLIRDVGTGASINRESARDPPKKQNLAVRFLLCFALNRNLAKLMDVKQSDKSIGALNGIRVISMTWVILGHTVIFGFTANITHNTPTILSWIQNHFGFQAVANAFFSVDTFFFLSGFLLAYLTLGRFRELRTAKAWALFYFHRYWRLTPLFAITILIWMYLPQFFGEGPIWQSHALRPYCPDYWWSSLLYISNFWPTNFVEQCIGWTWYLANDMQFFLISPLLLAPLFYYPVFGWLALIGTLLASFVSTGLIIGIYDVDLSLINSLSGLTSASYFSLVYGKPYCRIAPYLVGIGLGYIMHRIGNRKVKMNPVLAVIGWLAAAALAMSVVYGLYPSTQSMTMSRPASIVYGSLSRFVWALALAWVVYACKYGYGGWINTFLSWGFWVPLSRVTFSAYMIHPIVIMVFYDNFASPWHFSVYLMAFYFAGLASISYFIAIFLALAVEYPFANLEKLFLPSRVSPKKVEGGPETRGNAVVTMIEPSSPVDNGVRARGPAHENGIAHQRSLPT
ncbi:nose resistant to fluoxetine protein 6-like [Patiria miniata]|uniref:Nose resistant-to-fluoxetine protein N-terminal domain-containing protein n=1 Tax=Patiria miniata TaxID=46514 RepID=A0A914B3H5_PATMI|nr:nose resistant to fluoxetine protein 6-like [Patiria miniata]XP_038070355.1 nose resistant to fluoxetine protein 6-like [Patiria miniata]